MQLIETAGLAEQLAGQKQAACSCPQRWYETMRESEAEARELEPIFNREDRGAAANDAVLRRRAGCPAPSRQTVGLFPRYQNTVSSLPARERNKLKRIAGLIRSSFRPGCIPIRSVRIVGYADRDAQRGRAFEHRISLDRARAIELALKGSIGNSAISSQIVWEASGTGATSLLVRNPRTEAERARNRRVEIELASGPPTPGKSTNRPIRILDKFEVRKAQLKPAHILPIKHVAHHVVASWRLGTPVRTIHLVGHTDDTGQKSFNAALGNRRATAVQTNLSAAIDLLWPRLSARIRFVRSSMGARQPASGNQTAAGRGRNRRVEIFFPGIQPPTVPLSKSAPARFASELIIGSPGAGFKPKVVVLPGVMGSVLIDPSVPDAGKRGRGSTAAFCRTHVLSSNTFRALEAAIVLSAASVSWAVPGMLSALRNWICQCDMHVIWGTKDMIPWLFIQGDWCSRLVDGDGQLTGGNLFAEGFESLAGSYDGFLAELAPVADVLRFSYDWRLSNSISALKLEQAILDKWWPAFRDREFEIPSSDRVTIVAHSMGGLVARNLLESRSRKGPHLVSKLITVGTPHDGAPESYSHFNRKSLPIGTSMFDVVCDSAFLSSAIAAAVPALAPIIPHLPRILVPFIMGADLQLELVRSFAGVIQLLPNSPFVSVAGSTAEPLAASYARMNHLRGLGAPVSTVIGLLRDDLFGGTSGKSLADLNSYLRNPVSGVSKPVTYHLLAGSGRKTVTGFAVNDPPSWNIERFASCGAGTKVTASFRAGSPIDVAAGDGTVPLASAQALPRGSNIVLPPTFAGAEHGKLLKDLRVRAYCFNELEVKALAREIEEELLEVKPVDLPRHDYSLGTKPELAGLEIS